MDSKVSAIRQMHEEAGIRQINELERKIGVTERNIEISEGIIAGTPSDAERGRLIEKNKLRRHAVGSMNKEIRDIEQTIESRRLEAET